MSKNEETTPFGQSLIASLRQGVDDLRNDRPLRTTFVLVPPDPPKFTGERLRKLRARLRLPQVGMAALLNVSPKTLESWEQGVRNPSGASLRLLQVIEDPSILAQRATAPARRRRKRAP